MTWVDFLTICAMVLGAAGLAMGLSQARAAHKARYETMTRHPSSSVLIGPARRPGQAKCLLCGQVLESDWTVIREHSDTYHAPPGMTSSSDW